MNDFCFVKKFSFNCLVSMVKQFVPNFSDRIGEDDGFFLNGKKVFGHCRTVRLQTAVSLNSLFCKFHFADFSDIMN